MILQTKALIVRGALRFGFVFVFRCLGTKTWCISGLNEFDRQCIVRRRSWCLQSRGSSVCSLPHRPSSNVVKLRSLCFCLSEMFLSCPRYNNLLQNNPIIVKLIPAIGVINFAI
ncbi:uncharacterized protein LOC124829980 [Vigna umbellata]|uniref:uncharacterized protein LOC124829980 n=1 Tax=Vigna umbellata TaxID=87088 RepID=UPI001F5ED29E|nr:uncharacterized protein LOC124829980 [Vigna umbellata]